MKKRINKITNVLVPSDFSKCAQNAYDLALQICTQFNAKLTVLHARVLFSDDPNILEDNYEKIDQFLLNRLKNITGKASKHILIEHKITRGYSAAPAILEYVQNSNTDLIVMGTHGHTGLSHFLLGSVAEQVIRYSPCPVLTLRQDVKSVEKPMKILVTFDFTDLSKNGFHYAVNLARKFKSQVDLLYVFNNDVHPALYAWGMKSVKDIIPDIEARVEKNFKEAINAERGLNLNIKYHVVDGRPHREITKFANEHNHDLIIIATHAYSGIEKYLLGSVTEKVVRSSQTAVLILK